MHEQVRQRFRSSRRHRSGRRTVAVAVVAAAVAAGVLLPPAASAARPDPVGRSLTALVRADGLPAALAGTTDRHGRTRAYTAGVGDLTTGAPVPLDGQVRIGSNTKTFTAVVVLQLVAEGRMELDAHVDTYLPGLVRGDGIDGRRITVQQLLQHTSGLPNYTEHLGDDVRTYRPRELLDIALRHPATSTDGRTWAYSNTNYVLAGLLVEEVTRRPLAEEIERRIIRPLGLRHTYVPAPGDATLREPHPRGYLRESAGAPLRDVTETDPSWAWAAGHLVSTGSDLNRFFAALLGGRLLPRAQLDRMRSTVPAEETFGPGARYGLGLVSRPLPCEEGTLVWGHGGSYPGYETRGGATDDGRAVTVTVTVQLGDAAARERVDRVVDTALCR
ncbi:serine hydrolase domain-containing protein [Kitasatospora sp. NPDC054939]